MSADTSPLPDEPIRDVSQDELSRDETANRFADHVLRLNVSNGLVVGVMGAWGSGKTSFVNLMRPKLKECSSEIVDFNPWMFSGMDQLAANFFLEISAQLRENSDSGLSKIGDLLNRYGERAGAFEWVPVVGKWLGGASKVAKLFSQKKNDASLASQRDELIKQLDPVRKG